MTKRPKLTDENWRNVFSIRCRSKQGHPITPVVQSLCMQAIREDSIRYETMSADVFDATVPFGSTTKAKHPSKLGTTAPMTFRQTKEEHMTRVEFRLTMPGRNSWDGRWSGEERNYTLMRIVDDDQAAQLDGRSWSYGWSDGWRAEVSARVVRDDETLKPSHGFQGYDWMVASILRYGKIYADHERPGTEPA